MANPIKHAVSRVLREFREVARDADRSHDGSHEDSPNFQWADAIARDPEAIESLGQLASDGADIGRLLMVGLLFRCGRESFVSAWNRIHFGPVSLIEGCHQIDPEELMAKLAALEQSWGGSLGSPFPVPLLREVCEQVNRANRESEESQNRVMEVRTADGKKKNVQPIPGTARALIMGGHSLEESAGSLRREKGSGRHADTAENVLAVLVAGHLNAATGERRATYAARFITTVLGVESPSSDKESAFLSFKNRVEKYWQHQAVRERARLLAGAIDLPVKYD
jgi:hypothetical protein